MRAKKIVLPSCRNVANFARRESIPNKKLPRSHASLSTLVRNDGAVCLSPSPNPISIAWNRGGVFDRKRYIPGLKVFGGNAEGIVEPLRVFIFH